MKAYLRLAELQAEDGFHPKALAALWQALLLDPHGITAADCYARMARLYDSLGLPEQADAYEAFAARARGQPTGEKRRGSAVLDRELERRPGESEADHEVRVDLLLSDPKVQAALLAELFQNGQDKPPSDEEEHGASTKRYIHIRVDPSQGLLEALAKGYEVVKPTAAEMAVDRSLVVRSGRTTAEAPTSTEELMRRYAAGERTFDGAQLAGADLRAADLRGASLSSASLTYAKLDKARLNGARLSGSWLNNASLREAELEFVDLHGSTLTGASLENAKLDGAHLDKAYLRGANLRGATLGGVSARHAVFREASFANATLNAADFRWADLEDSDLSNADFTGVNLHRASLVRARLENTRLVRADLREASLEKAQLKGASLRKANLAGATLRDAVLTDADLYGADLRGANLSRAQDLKLQFCLVQGAVFSPDDPWVRLLQQHGPPCQHA